MTEQTITAETAVQQLIAEGYRREDVLGAVDSLIDAGLEVDQPDEGTILTPEEVDVLRDQLGPAPKRTGRPSEGKLISLRVPAEHLTAGAERAAQLDIDRTELFRRYIADGLRRPLFTVQIEAGNGAGDIWQAAYPAETVEAEPGETAQDIAEQTAQNQTVADGNNWRVVVWSGADADTGTEPAATVHAGE